ncbi:MAG TPA: response regulator transcription factor [Candidatus Binataceae bacterium]|jgi:DNA-binding NarL/FixJ family response regulator|nr:response regulator transcription factor [Candidatus Binataceae bacterium]
MGSERIRVVLADDHRLFREALRTVLERECEVVGEAASGEEAVALAARTRPDIVLLDVGMPGVGGLNAAHRLARESPNSKVVILSQHDDEEYVIEAMVDAGAAGYLVKTDAASELLSALRAVATGRRYLSATVAPAVLARLKNASGGTRAGGATVKLTRREREVLSLIGEGATSKDIAARLGISPKTAQVHRDNLKQKLKAKSTAAIVRYAIKHKLIRAE